MTKWYRKTVTRAVILLLAILSGAVVITNLFALQILSDRGLSLSEVGKMNSQTFEESEEFSSMVENYMYEVQEKIRLEHLFENDGAYNPQKLVDVMEWSEKGTVSGENSSGVVYTIEELVNWGQTYQRTSTDNLYNENGVIVCQKPDGNYYYYYTSDFFSLIESGKLQFQMDADQKERFLDGLRDGEFRSSGFYNFDILDENGNLLYTDCWNFGQSLIEKYAPVGADNLLEVVNNNPQLNGRLSLIYDNIAEAVGSFYDELQNYEDGWDYLEEGNTNFTYLYVDEDTKKVITNKKEYTSYADAESNIKKMTTGKSVKYMVVYPELKDFKTNMNVSHSNEWINTRSYNAHAGEPKWNDTFAVAVDTSYPVQDAFYQNSEIYQTNIPYIKNALRWEIICGLIFLVTVIWLTLGAGRKAEDEELHLFQFDYWKTEVGAASVILLWAVGTVFFVLIGYDVISILYRGFYEMRTTNNMTYLDSDSLQAALYVPSVYVRSIDFSDTAAIFTYSVFALTCFFGGYLSLVRRIKAKNLWENSLLKRFFEFMKQVAQNIKVTRKMVLILLVYFLFQIIAVISADAFLVAILLIVDVVIFWRVMTSIMEKNRLRKGIEEIASGNMSYQIPTKGLHGDNRILAAMINGIGTGLNKAVAEAMKNERLKTDLITNVSHDIKTPLTSILNYVGILRNTDPSDPKVQDYLDILEKKAQRLKTLTEDVVEASKVSSGNISLEFMDLDLVEMIQQTQGELEEKFNARNLTLITELPQEPAVVHVDGRRMWRVLENVYGNAAKYAMPGTRVYAALKVEETKVSFSLKNVSEHQLNIRADELTERFIRGDISRSTEGSGLGLSIAKSLTTMQGGTFDLYLDGDLFRVDITFPRVKSTQKSQPQTEDAED